MNDHSRPVSGDTDDADLLNEIRERFTYATDQWRDIRAEAKRDMRFVGGDPWDPKDRKQRQDAGRVCLSLDELHQYFNQLINEVRANPRAPKFDPTGNGANDATARFYQDKYREIEYRSQAQVAYTTAFQNAVHQGYGWFRYNTRWQPKSFVQDLWIEDVPNPDLIIPDPDALRPSSSDQKYLYNLRSLSHKEFTREFPDAQVTDFSSEIINQAPAWIAPERVQIAEYWMVEPVEKELLLLQGPNGATQGFYVDELDTMPPGWRMVDRRKEEVPSVCMYLTNGVEILRKPGQAEKKVRWAGKFIPFVSIFGMVIYVDEGSGPKRKILSMTRLARDPFMLYCYYRTCQAELVGMTPKIPYFVRRGSLKPDQLLNLQKSLHEPIAVIEVEAFIDGMPGTPPEFPLRNPYQPYIQELEVGAESARRAIQAAMGTSPLPTQAQRVNEKSGTALKQIESAQQKGSYHFIDHYNEALHQGATIAEDLIDKVYDTARQTGVRDARGNAKVMTINDPMAQGPNALASTKGDHTVTITEGPAFESQRQEADRFGETLVENIQMIAGVAGPKVAAALLGMTIKNKNLGELGDEMAEMVTPPEFQSKDGQSPIPPQVQAQMAQLQQELQQAQQALATKQPELQAKAAIAQQDNATKLEIEKMRQEGQFAVASLKAQIESINTALAAMQAERAAINQDHKERVDVHQFLADAGENQASRAHDLQMAAVTHAAALSQAEQAHQHALEQGQQTASPAGETAP